MVWQKGEKSIIEPYFRIQKWIFFYDNVNKSCLFGKYFWWFPISSFLHHRSVLFFSYILDKLFNFFCIKNEKRERQINLIHHQIVTEPKQTLLWKIMRKNDELKGALLFMNLLKKWKMCVFLSIPFFLLEEIFLLSICWINKSNSIVLLVKSMHGC